MHITSILEAKKNRVLNIEGGLNMIGKGNIYSTITPNSRAIGRYSQSPLTEL